MVLEEIVSQYSGKLRVIKSLFGDPYISTGYLTQSGGLVHDVWQPVTKLITHHSSLHKFLILGLAGGTLAKLISKANPKASITGVEIDPAMVYLGKKYLGLDKINNLKIIIKDANDYLLKTKDYFDVIFVDLYLNDQVPDFVYSKKFLQKLRAKIIIINHLFYDEDKKQQAHKLIDQCQMLNYQITLRRVLTNVLIIATPKSLPEIPSPPHQIAA